MYEIIPLLDSYADSIVEMDRQTQPMRRVYKSRVDTIMDSASPIHGSSHHHRLIEETKSDNPDNVQAHHVLPDRYRSPILLSHKNQEDEELEDKDTQQGARGTSVVRRCRLSNPAVLTHCAATISIYAAAVRTFSKYRVSPSALSIQAYDECYFNASMRRGQGGPNNLAGRRYGSRTLLDIGQFPPPSLFTCENLYFHRLLLSDDHKALKFIDET
ncbi:uncharacterized protein ARMOST_02907 [Armillaria ostoyae]|uniref:Uncharacterized protein n=1 Tax=Armillaria ostoyae TaxID=47428 RepID=A0A284QT20_ARMOS|nr:uncharacterized protein ARMOST_02907 [Armillaria ostoyae]